MLVLHLDVYKRQVPDSINGILPSPTWLCYEKVNMYLYDGTDGNRHLFYASDARSTEALLELADDCLLYTSRCV